MSESIEETIARLRASVTANPNNPVTRLMLGRAFQQVGKLDEALQSCRRATVLKADYFEAFVSLGNVQRAKADPDAAATAYASAVQIKPSALDIWLELARSSRDAGNDANAAEAYAMVIKERDADVEALRDGGLASHRSAGHLRATEWLSHVVGLDAASEANTEIHLALARSAFALGNTGRACISYARAIELGATSCDVLVEEAKALLADGRWQEALQSYACVLQREPSSVGVAKSRGELARAHGCHEDAHNSFEIWSASAPDDGEAFLALGTAKLALNRDLESVEVLSRAARLLSSREDAMLAWGQALRRVGRFRESAEVLERVATDTTTLAETHTELAQVYVSLARPRDEKATLERAALRWPSSPQVHQTLAESWLREGEAERAIDAFQTAVRLTPEDVPLRHRLAEVCLRAEAHEKSFSHFDILRKRLTAEHPLFASSHGGAGQSLERLSRPMEALESLELALTSIAPQRDWSVALGRVFLVLGRIQEAETVFLKAAAKKDESNSEKLSVEAFEGAGDAQTRLGRLNDAQISYTRAFALISCSQSSAPGDEIDTGSRLSLVSAPVRLGPIEDAAKPESTAALLAKLASVELALGQPTKALARADQGLIEAPEDGLLHRVRAGALAALGRTRDALDSIEQALWQLPDDPNLIVAMAMTLAELGKHEKALPHLQKAIALQPEDASIRRAYARTQQTLGANSEALSAYRMCAESKLGTAEDWLDVARLEEQRGSLEAAARAFRDATRLEPKRAEAYRGAGRLYRKTARLEDAMQALRHAVRLDENNLEGRLELARTFRELGRLDDAAEAYLRYIALEGVPSAGPHRELGNLYISMHEDAHAETELALAVSLQSGDIDTYRTLAAVRLRLGRSAEAVQSLEAAYANGDRSPETQMALAKGREAAGDVDGALTLFRALQSANGDASLAVGRLLLSRGLFGDAIAALEKAIIDGVDAEEVHLGVAESALALGDHLRAWVAVRRLLVLVPHSLSAQRLRARVATIDGKWQEAAEAYEKVLDVEPNSVDALRGVGIAYVNLGRFQQAHRALQAITQREPHDLAARALFGRVLLHLGQPREAVEHLNASLATLQTRGSDEGLWLRATEDLAQALFALGATADATTLLHEALQRKPDHAAFWRIRGEANMSRGELPEASQAFERLVTLEPDNGPARAQWATAMAWQGQDQQAITEFARARARGFVDGPSSYVYGICLQRQERFGEASDAYSQARNQGVDIFECLRALGDVSVSAGRDVEAVSGYVGALGKKPEDVEARVALAAALHRLGRTNEAMDHYRLLRAASPVRAEQLFRWISGRS